MKVKIYNAPTMADALEKIRAELGKDAVILNSKVLYTGGFLGFFKKKSIEVIVAIDPEIKRAELLQVKQKKKLSQSQTGSKPKRETTDMLGSCLCRQLNRAYWRKLRKLRR